MAMNCLDTYALMELFEGNPKFMPLFNSPFVITNWTLAEFYKTLLREYGKPLAIQWVRRIQRHALDVDTEVLIKAVDLHFDHRKEDLSLFDAVGYLYALESGFPFVTGDKWFHGRKGVHFMQK